MKDKYLIEDMLTGAGKDGPSIDRKKGDIGQEMIPDAAVHTFVTSDLSDMTTTFMNRMLGDMKVIGEPVLRFTVKEAGDIDDVCSGTRAYIRRTKRKPVVAISYMVDIGEDPIGFGRLKRFQSENGLNVTIWVYAEITGKVYKEKMDELVNATDLVWAFIDRGCKCGAQYFDTRCIRIMPGIRGKGACNR